jgi:Glycosyl transferase family 2/Glycosyl transferases group 1
MQQTPSATRTVGMFRNRHRGETVIVCGCGASLNALPVPAGCLTIGTNDVGRLFDPDYLVVVNPPAQFTGDRYRYVEQSRARFVFSQLDLPLEHAPLVKFRLGRFGAAGFEEPDLLHYTQNSPYVAVSLALFMGASRIGLIGVDFTDHHFFAATGSHPLSGRLDQINREYARLRDAAAALGAELVNLSAESRITSLPRVSADVFLNGDPRPKTRIFFVTYQFLSCGDVFTQGLRHAAEELGIESAEADWNDPDLPGKVAKFRPDLMLVVHGRHFARRWASTFSTYRTAVWLVDEPYEVDDSSQYSRQFSCTFVNDPATVGRHHNAHYLPVCYDPHVHTKGGDARPHRVGFIGGANATRERMLAVLADRGLLSYIVGGPWRDARLNALCTARTVPPAATAALYRATRIVVNVFRDVHHFNRDRVSATSLNPRVYEAIACGALVVSEWRPEIEALVPEMPTFRTEDELVPTVEQLLADPARCEELRTACAARLSVHTYARRLKTAIEVASNTMAPAARPAPALQLPSPLSEQWTVCGPVDWSHADDTLTLRSVGDGRPGSERGLASREPCSRADLAFDVFVPTGACLVAKIHQRGQSDGRDNSYHLYCDDRGTYLARHHHVFGALDMPRNEWVALRLTCADGVLQVFQSGRLVHRVRDSMLSAGYAVLSVKAGSVRLRHVRLAPLDASEGPDERIAWQHVHGEPRTPPPRVSIVTTVYDRVECLRRCLQSVKALSYRDCEHIVVSDAPPPAVLDEITRIVKREDDGRVRSFNLSRRFNNWGITPAAVGLRRAIGEYVCFLSDDNGYTPDHVVNLVEALDRNPALGFAYSSCHYAGRLVLSHPEPAAAHIDLGQPMFRRQVLATCLGNDLPFDTMAWDWHLLDTLMKKGVTWKHVDVPSFIFRLAQYPDLLAGGSSSHIAAPGADSHGRERS